VNRAQVIFDPSVEPWYSTDEHHYTSAMQVHYKQKKIIEK